MSDASQALRSPTQREALGNSGHSDREGNLGRAFSDLAACFPSESFREGQYEALEIIHDAFVNRGRRFVVAELPTGIGKSHIAIALAKFYGRAHVLTVQKILQAQYEASFPSLVYSMSGRGAYTCRQDSKLSCAQGPCRRSKLIRCPDCPYKAALARAHASPITVHNFDSYYYQNKALPYAPRDILIVDEAHNLEQRYLSFMSFTISNRKDPNLDIPEFNSAPQYKEFLRQQRDEIDNNIIGLEDQDTLTASELAYLEEARELSTKLTIFLARIETTEYVVDYESKEWQAVTFRPVFVGSYVIENLFPAGERALMLSATILDKTMFCRSVGLDPKDVEFIQMDSYFPVRNRPIIRRYVGSMAFKEINDSLPKAVRALRAILDKFPDKRGIVQTHSERIANYIQQNLGYEPRLTFRRDYKTVDDMLVAHAAKEGSFIVASGLREGLDLTGDLSRVQVIMKVPYPDLGDKRTKRRKDLDASWYGVQTALSFVQMIGRSVRSSSDKALTYILDSSFEMFYRMNRRFIPRYIREAIDERAPSDFSD